MFPIAFIGSLGPLEMMIVGIIALLLFGKRLPEVARSLGKGVIEFKKGLRGIEDDIDTNLYSPRNDSTTTSNTRPTPKDESVETSAPKFEPPKSEPTSTYGNDSV
jgi:sec-independent protein translocase protein TatA